MDCGYSINLNPLIKNLIIVVALNYFFLWIRFLWTFVFGRRLYFESLPEHWQKTKQSKDISVFCFFFSMFRQSKDISVTGCNRVVRC
jgi:hypothetical protein